MNTLLAAVLAAVGIVGGIAVGAEPSSALAVLGGQGAVVVQVDWFVDLVETIDRILEAVVDLLQTVNQLFGGGGD